MRLWDIANLKMYIIWETLCLIKLNLDLLILAERVEVVENKQKIEATIRKIKIFWIEHTLDQLHCSVIQTIASYLVFISGCSNNCL